MFSHLSASPCRCTQFMRRQRHHVPAASLLKGAILRDPFFGRLS
jgi:hypothetical protein